MTREEAIAYIKAIKNGLHETGKDFPYRDEIIPVAKDALEMAIKALEQEPVLGKIKSEIDSHCSDNRDRNDGLYIAMKIIDKYIAEKNMLNA